MSLFSSKNTYHLEGGRNLHSILDQTLYKMPTVQTPVTWADAVEGTLITGSIGSGKSSGAGRHIALAMLQNGFGMLVLCAKPGEADTWRKYAAETGRSDDLVTFDKDSSLKFNVLEYKLKRSGKGAGETINIVNALMSLNEQNRIHLSGGDGKEEPFWNNSLRRIISRAIDLLRAANEDVSIANMRKVVALSFDEADMRMYHDLVSKMNTERDIDPQERKEAKDALLEWAKSNYFVWLIQYVSNLDIQDGDTDLLLNYWMRELPKLSDRTKSIIIESFLGIVEPFLNKGILRTHFSQGLSEELKPEHIYTQNKVVVLDFSIKEYGIAGGYAASIYKTTFQAAMERRDLSQETNPKPVGLFIDEYHNFVTKDDSSFQTTCRSSWVANVIITQSIQNLYFTMSGNMPMAEAKSLLGNLNLKIFCCNSEADNNEWASNMIGKHYAYLQNIQIDKQENISQTQNKQLVRRVAAEEFTTLKTGRKQNKHIVEAIIFKAGKVWGRDQENYALVEFKQG